jgi:hypothetical protein
VKIATLLVENVKRVQLVSFCPTADGLTVIGGKCGEGKTSILDSIAWLLGGDAFKPSNPVHEGAERAYIKGTLSNGWVIERDGKNATLKVTDAAGKKGGQALLNDVISMLALDLPKFMDSRGTVRANMLLECFPGLGPAITKYNADIKRAYDERTALGRVAEMKAKHAEDLPFIDGVPDAPLSGTEMVAKLQAAMAVNAEHANTRRNAAKIRTDLERATADKIRTMRQVASLELQLEEAKLQMQNAAKSEADITARLADAEAAAASLVDEDMTAVKVQLAEIDTVNAKIRQNLEKAAAEDEAETLKAQYKGASDAIDAMRGERLKLLAGVSMPMPELSIDEAGELIYRGRQWDCMSHSEQLRVSVAICAAVKPSCGFVLMDKLESMDVDTLNTFGEWLTERGLQCIATRVSTGDECSIVIEDGMVATKPVPRKYAV